MEVGMWMIRNLIWNHHPLKPIPLKIMKRVSVLGKTLISEQSYSMISEDWIKILPLLTIVLASHLPNWVKKTKWSLGICGSNVIGPVKCSTRKTMKLKRERMLPPLILIWDRHADALNSNLIQTVIKKMEMSSWASHTKAKDYRLMEMLGMTLMRKFLKTQMMISMIEASVKDFWQMKWFRAWILEVAKKWMISQSRRLEKRYSKKSLKSLKTTMLPAKNSRRSILKCTKS